MKVIHHVVDLHAEPSKVWWALTEPDGMAAWWSTRVRSDGAAVGALTHWTFAEGFNPIMKVTAIDEPVSLTWQCVGGHEPWEDNTFQFQLAKLDDGQVRVRFWQNYATELSDDAYGTYNFNWGYYLESLRLLCVDGKGKPYQAD
jgi:uncharacterized protein YndB with AHSA1/START domain